MKWFLLGAVAALAAGVVLVAVSVVEGGASVVLFVFVPVVSGSSLTFLLGVALLVVGFLSLPFALAEDWNEAPPALPSNGAAPPEGQGGVGGVVLIGPIPIVFGSWKGISRRTRRWLALAGAVLLTVAFVWFVLFLMFLR
ncbi:MAG: TIGR00304 family membrane protein [Thermoplasmata archaeon]